MKATVVGVLLVFGFSCQSKPEQESSWGGTSEAPNEVSWTTVIASPEEPGERLVVEGRVYLEDGHTPAPGVTIYAYHTNAQGEYPKRGDETGNGRLHGYLRGWMRTDSSGRYRIETIRPAPYPTHDGEPAHIHYTIQPSGGEEYWINAAWFSDDPRVTDELVSGLKRKGGSSNVMEVSRDSDGVWHGQRDIVLAVYE